MDELALYQFRIKLITHFNIYHIDKKAWSHRISKLKILLKYYEDHFISQLLYQNI